MTPMQAFEWMRENMLPYYPLGVYRDVVAEGYANAAEAAAARAAECPIAMAENPLLASLPSKAKVEDAMSQAQGKPYSTGGAVSTEGGKH